MSIEIRALTADDAEAYRALRLRGLKEEPEAFGTSYEEALARPISHTVERLRATPLGNGTFGAFDGPSLVGMATLVRDDYANGQHKAMVAGMYVVPEARRKGVGTLLLQVLIDYARTLPGLEQLYLGVGTTREAPVGLYRSLGFEVYGTEPHALKVGGKYVDEHLMVLWLIPRP